MEQITAWQRCDTSLEGGQGHYSHMEAGKKKRKRTIITPEQLAFLERTYQQDQWPNRLRKMSIAHQLGMSEQFVCIWFQNKRARMKRETEEQVGRDLDEGEYSTQKSKSETTGIENQELQNIDGDDTIIDSQEISQSIMQGTRLQDQKKRSNKDNIGLNLSLCTAIIGKSPNANGATKVLGKLDPANKKERKKIIERNSTAPYQQNYQNWVTGSTGRLVIHPRRSGNPRTRLKLVSADNICITKAASAPCTTSNRTTTSITCQTRINVDQETKPKVVPVATIEHTGDVHRSAPPTLFRAIVNMIALAEGGILAPSDPQFPSAVNDALYGILLNGDSRLVYDEDYGLDIEELKDLTDDTNLIDR